MNIILRIPFVIAFFTMATITMAQTGIEKKEDDLLAFKEFVSLGNWYLHSPLQVQIHFVNLTTPSVAAEDNSDVNMLLYYGQHDFYMNAGGLEQIVNDSLTILINNEARMIRLFPNVNTVRKTLESTVSMFLPDSSLEKLAKKYAIMILEPAKGLKEMTVQSKDKISGTDFNKESIKVTYQSESHQPVSYVTTRRSLVPVDLTMYKQFEKDPGYAGRLLKFKTKNETDIFLVVKEKVMQCSFAQVNYDMQSSPVVQGDRIVRMSDGEYKPAKKFEAYLLSNGN